MTKKQKIWLGISLSMFAIPEILWSPVVNFYYQLFQSGDVYPIRNNYLMNSDNLDLFKFILLIQLISLIGLFFLLINSKINKFIKYLFILLSIVLFFIFGFAVLFVFSNNPQFG